MTDTNRMTQERLDAIRARVEAATPGEWKLDYYQGVHDIKLRSIYIEEEGEMGEDVLWPSGFNSIGVNDANAELIVHARGYLTALLAEVDRMRAEMEQARALLALTLMRLDDAQQGTKPSEVTLAHITARMYALGVDVEQALGVKNEPGMTDAAMRAAEEMDEG